jgi:hypothetical protein
MLGIGRRAVLTDRRTRGIVGVEAVVTLGTQRAKLTEPERVVVAAMGLDVICDGCGHHAAGLKADAAQRFGVELDDDVAVPSSRCNTNDEFRDGAACGA